MPTTIVFDIGNVLLAWDMRNLLARLAPADELDHIIANVCLVSWHTTLDGGATYADAIAQRVALYPGHAALIEAYEPRWQETISGPIHGSVALLEELRAAGLPTYAITNFPAEKFAETCELYPFLQGFAGVVVSGRERMMKPDPAIFELFLERYELAAQDCVFIDDSLANITTAKALGFTALHFVDPQTLRAELGALGFPV